MDQNIYEYILLLLKLKIFTFGMPSPKLVSKVSFLNDPYKVLSLLKNLYLFWLKFKDMEEREKGKERKNHPPLLHRFTP